MQHEAVPPWAGWVSSLALIGLVGCGEQPGTSQNDGDAATETTVAGGAQSADGTADTSDDTGGGVDVADGVAGDANASDGSADETSADTSAQTDGEATMTSSEMTSENAAETSSANSAAADSSETSGSSDSPDGEPTTADDGASSTAEELAPGDDRDGDGITNGDEINLGTSPFRYDTDGDGLGDAAEIVDVASPTDTDGDGVIDALEQGHFDNDLDGQLDTDDPISGWQVVWGGFSPSVILNDGASSARLEVHLVGADSITRLRAGISPNLRDPTWLDYDLAVDAAPIGVEPVDLYDDGTHGDRLAGDGVFTRAGFTTSADIVSVNGVRGSVYLNGLYVTTDGEEVEHLIGAYNDAGYKRMPGVGFELCVLDAAAVVDAQEVSESLQATSHILNIVDAELTEKIQRSLDISLEDYRDEIAAASLQHLGSVPDFLYVFTERPVFDTTQGIHLQIQNQVEGIGVQIRTAPDTLGSLQSVVVLNLDSETPIGHETLHRWGVKLDPSFGFDTEGSHWGLAGTYGVLGGFDPGSLVDHGDGTYTIERFAWAGNNWTTTPFSDIELYLMGLLPADELDPIPVFFDEEPVDLEDELTVTISATLEWVTAQDIIDAHGERTPAYGAAQTSFNAAFVVASAEPMTQPELSFLHHHAETYGLPSFDGGMTFAEASGGRAEMVTELPALSGL